MTKFNFTMSDADIASGTIVVGKGAKKLRDQIHFIGVSIIRNWSLTGDASTATRRASELLNAIDPSHKQKCVNWFGLHCKLTLNDEKNAFTYTETTVSSDVFQAAKAESMFVLTEDKEPTPFDLNAEIVKLIERARKHAAKPKEGDVVPMDRLRALTFLSQAPAA